MLKSWLTLLRFTLLRIVPGSFIGLMVSSSLEAQAPDLEICEDPLAIVQTAHVVGDLIYAFCEDEDGLIQREGVPVSSDFEVDDDFEVGDVQVYFNLEGVTNPFNEQKRLDLTSPEGTTVSILRCESAGTLGPIRSWLAWDCTFSDFGSDFQADPITPCSFKG